MIRTSKLLFLVIACICPCVGLAQEDGSATATLRAYGVRPGLIVVVDADKPTDFSKEKLGGPAGLVHRTTGGGLPYVNDLVNTLCIPDFAAFRTQGGSLDEVLRVVAPEGVVLLGNTAVALPEERVKNVQRSANRVVFTKAWPKQMDEWTHFEHDASRSSVSKDKLAGIPQGLRWIGGQVWTNYATFSFAAPVFVSAGGRNFYWSSTGTKRRRTGELVCRDAFSGVQLWSLATPCQPDSRGLVAGKERVYVYVSQRILAEYDAATGKQLRVLRDVPRSSHFLRTDGKFIFFASGGQLSVLDEKSAKTIWERSFVGEDDYWKTQDRIVIGNGKLFMVSRAAKDAPLQISCLDLQSGEEVWTVVPDLTAPDAETDWPALVSCTGDYLIVSNGTRRLKFDARYGQKGKAANYALSTKDGKLLGKYVFEATGHGGFATNAYLLDELIWSKTKEAWVGWDPKTGKEVRRTQAPAATRCYPDHVVGSLILTNKMSFTDTATGKDTVFTASRSACGSGFFPANGMVCTMPTRCVCFPMVRGVLGLSPTSGMAGRRAEHPLVKGPAFGTQAGDVPVGQWSTYRATPNRGASIAATLSDRPIVKWRQNGNEPATSPVVAGGRVFIALPESRRVAAMNAADGRQEWSCPSGGSVSTPPTVWGGLVLFGSTDGWVRCVTAKQGELVWKLRAAPADRRIVVRGRVESLWPVPGSVLVQDGLAVFAAGRHTYTDGGIFYRAVRVETGETVWTQKRVASDGSSLADVPVSDGRTVYFGGQFQFDLKTGAPLKTGTGMMLWAPLGLPVDNTFASHKTGTDNLRTQWLYADKTRAARLQGTLSFSADYVTESGAAGSMLAFDGARIFGFLQDPSAAKSNLFGRNGAERWDAALPPRAELRLTSLIRIGDKLLLGGALPGDPPTGKLIVVSTVDGRKLSELALPAPVRWDGLATDVAGSIYAVTQDGVVTRLAAP
jgi:outer membrane protein assembly factor BamB